jgi:hypothetical protein
MLGAGEASLAAEYASMWGLAPEALAVSPEQLAAEQAARQARYLQVRAAAGKLVGALWGPGWGDGGKAVGRWWESCGGG